MILLIEIFLLQSGERIEKLSQQDKLTQTWKGSETRLREAETN